MGQEICYQKKRKNCLWLWHLSVMKEKIGFPQQITSRVLMRKFQTDWFKVTFLGGQMTDLGWPSRNGKLPGRKTVLWETVAWENACLGNCLPPYPGQTDACLRLASGVGLSGITGRRFNLSLTRCIKNNGQRK